MAYRKLRISLAGAALVFLSAAPLHAQSDTIVLPPDATDREAGEILFQVRCALCHTGTSLLALTGPMQSDEDIRRLDTHLKDHYAPDDAARARIMAYLADGAVVQTEK
ncbi:MAG: hypothetical protein JXR14_08490 [Paracoccaceae bacterium]